MNHYLNDSIFWIEVEKIEPNPYQPRRDFDPNALRDLADSIRQYGILQPLVVTRKEEEKEDGGIRVTYELIAGERRLRASKIAGIAQVPVVIRSVPEDPKEKLEIAIIENLQREDLNPIDRARAFARLVEEFGFKHVEVAKKVGRSREYVSNTLRLLDLPEEVLTAVREGKVSEGHARTVMMLAGRPDEQKVLFKEIIYKKLSVREAEAIAREIAHDRVRKKKYIPDPELMAIEGKLSSALGTRVHIERRENGGKLVIDFFSNDDLEEILSLMKSNKVGDPNALMNRFIAAQEATKNVSEIATPGEPLREETSKQRDLLEVASEEEGGGSVEEVKINSEIYTSRIASHLDEPSTAEEGRGSDPQDSLDRREDLPEAKIPNMEDRFVPVDMEKDEGDDTDLYSIKHFNI